MGKARKNEVLYVIGNAIIASIDQGVRLCRPEECERASRADAELERLRSACRINDLQKIFDKRLVNADPSGDVLQPYHIRV